MRNILIFAAILAGLGIYMAQMADTMVPANKVVAANQGRQPVVSDIPASSGLRNHIIPKDGRGHFSTDGRIDGRKVSFMVDTGASVIALTESSAALVGIRPARGDYNAPVSTANGVVKGARARLPSVDVGGIEVRDVEAMVLPDNVLSENLLGLSYLSRLRRFEFANGKLVLEQ
jgi:aspartyl protease family protein